MTNEPLDLELEDVFLATTEKISEAVVERYENGELSTEELCHANREIQKFTAGVERLIGLVARRNVS